VPDYQFLALMFFTLISFFLCVQASCSLPYVSATFLMKYVLRQNIYIYIYFMCDVYRGTIDCVLFESDICIMIKHFKIDVIEVYC
jgi:hypothetical protein